MITRSYGRNMFSFIGNYQTVFQSSVILHFFQHWMNFSCSTSFFYIFSVLKFGHSKRCAVTSHCFKLCLLGDIWYGASFYMLICPLCDSCWNTCWLVFKINMFIVSLLSLNRSLYTWTTVVYQMWLLQIFFPSLWLVF